MSLDGVILPLLMFLGMMSLAVASIYISARIAMKRLGLTKKAFFRNSVFCFFVGLASQWGYGMAEHLGLSWLWFSIPWVFYVLWGMIFGLVFALVFALIDLRAKRLG
ncbi:hypothetical protein [Bartonella tribocorum]|nr:hypothetical protein [Bartonella tribocorum]CDO49557.1 hypothetical protein BM1374166_01913 [Bartonella tribocorum]